MDIKSDDNPEEVCSGIAETLRQQRQASGVSLEEAEEATKISRRILRLLEAGRFDDLPSPTHLRGFVRIYANFLGLDTAMLLDQLGRDTDQSDTEVAPQDEKKHYRSYSDGFRWQRLILPGLLFIALLISSLFFSPEEPERTSSATLITVDKPAPSEPDDSVQDGHQEDVQIVEPEEQPEQDRQDTVHDEQGSQSVSIETPQRPDGILVKLKARQNCGVVIIIDGGAYQRYELESGDQIEWKAVDTIAFDLEDGAAVELELNGKPVRFDGVSGRSLYLMLDADGVVH